MTRLALTGVSKRFGSTQALQDVSLRAEAGEIHALVGENGAGKSTLMKILSGAESADGGEILLDGRPFRPRNPAEARRQGVVMVYQELTLAPHLSVEANVTLGMEATRLGFLRGREQQRAVQQAFAALQHQNIPLTARVAALSPAEQQIVEIARALLTEVRVLILDEPTSSLGQTDAQRLFALLDRLRMRGVTILYISHFLEEVERLAQRYTVLRDGRSVDSGLVEGTSRQRLVEQMVGRRLEEQYPKIPHERGALLLEISDLAGPRLPMRANLRLHRGEILGIAGLIGAGRTELLRAIFGLDMARRGRIAVHTGSGPISLESRQDPARSIQAGLGLVSEDRKAEGLALLQSIADNLTWSRLARYLRHGWLDLRRRRREVDHWLERIGVRCRDSAQPVGELSGGNQQKVALGRLLHQEAEVFLLDEPTRGIDVASKAEVYRLMGELAARGKGVLFVSSYLPELLGVCDQLAVMSRGRLGEIRPIGDWTADQIMHAATGQAELEDTKR